MTMEFSPDPRSLERLSFAIEMGQGQFKLMVVRCNYGPLIDAVMARLVEICPVTLLLVQVGAGDGILEKSLEALERSPEAGCVVVRVAAGLDREDLNQIFGAANRAREVFRDRVARPVVLWLDDEGEAVFMDAASDLESLSTGASLGFELERLELLEWVRSQVDGLVEMALGGRGCLRWWLSGRGRCGRWRGMEAFARRERRMCWSWRGGPVGWNGWAIAIIRI